MGNRCVITDEARSIGIYLHWNGGIGSVEAFLTYCGLKGCRGFGSDSSYAAARLAQVVGNFFGGTLSLGISAYSTDENMDPGDNGIYVIKEWQIVKHLVSTEIVGKDGESSYELQETDLATEKREYDLDEMLHGIDEAQPEKERLGEYLEAEIIETASLQIGDVYYKDSIEGLPEKAVCCGYGNGTVNGSDVTGMPFGVTECWKQVNDVTDITLEAIAKASRNINCYIRTPKVRVVRNERR